MLPRTRATLIFRLRDTFEPLINRSACVLSFRRRRYRGRSVSGLFLVDRFPPFLFVSREFGRAFSLDFANCISRYDRAINKTSIRVKQARTFFNALEAALGMHRKLVNRENYQLKNGYCGGLFPIDRSDLSDNYLAAPFFHFFRTRSADRKQFISCTLLLFADKFRYCPFKVTSSSGRRQLVTF